MKYKVIVDIFHGGSEVDSEWDTEEQALARAKEINSIPDKYTTASVEPSVKNQCVCEEDKMNPKPMDAAPRDGTTILAWHVVWKCWTAIQYRNIEDKLQWVDVTISTLWPEEAFSHWMEQPEAPKDKQ